MSQNWNRKRGRPRKGPRLVISIERHGDGKSRQRFTRTLPLSAFPKIKELLRALRVADVESDPALQSAA